MKSQSCCQSQDARSDRAAGQSEADAGDERYRLATVARGDARGGEESGHAAGQYSAAQRQDQRRWVHAPGEIDEGIHQLSLARPSTAGLRRPAISVAYTETRPSF